MEYRLQISTNANFTGTLAADINVGHSFYCDLSVHPIELMPGTQYYWRVADSNNVFSPTYMLRSGLETSPFKVEVSSDNFVSKVIDLPVTEYEFSPGTPLLRSSSYQWRVTGGGAISSKAQAFQTKPPLVMPTNAQANFINGRVFRISWDAIVGATEYRIYYKTHEGGMYDGEGLVRLSVAQAPEGMGIVEPYFDVAAGSPDPYLDLVGSELETSYWFAVTAVDEEGSTGLTEISTAVMTREILGVSNITASSLNRQINVTWSPSPDAFKYRIYYKTHADGDYDGSGLRLSESGPILGAYIDIKVSDMADPYHPTVGFWGGVFGTLYWFAVAPIDGGNVVGEMIETASGFQLSLMPPESIDVAYVDGYYRIRWTRNSLDALSTGFLIYYKTDHAALDYRGTGLHVESLVGEDAPSPVLVDQPYANELKLYGGEADTPYWFAIASRDALGNTSVFTPADKNVTGFTGELPVELTRAPGQMGVVVDQLTKQVTLTWTVEE